MAYKLHEPFYGDKVEVALDNATAGYATGMGLKFVDGNKLTVDLDWVKEIVEEYLADSKN